MVYSYSRKLQNNLDDLELHEPARGSSEKKMLSEKSMGRRHYAKLKTKPHTILCVYVHVCMCAYAHTQDQIQISGYT